MSANTHRADQDAYEYATPFDQRNAAHASSVETYHLPTIAVASATSQRRFKHVKNQKELGIVIRSVSVWLRRGVHAEVDGNRLELTASGGERFRGSGLVEREPTN
jgi:hypothetical protein